MGGLAFEGRVEEHASKADGEVAEESDEEDRWVGITDTA